MTNKADQEYWDKYHSGFEFQIAPEIHPIRQLIEEYFPKANDKTCIEIGCYPGALLAVFGELGYKLYGIDLSENLDILPGWLESQNYNMGEFWKEDFLKFDPGYKFDVVSSFGFIEHFTNWEDILYKHIELVEAGGHLIIEAPNFIGTFQHFLHKNFDKKNYDHHHIPAMNIDNWSEILKDNGFEIKYKGYFGLFHFWTEIDHSRKFIEWQILRTLITVRPFLKTILPKNKKAYSPYGGVIAQRIG